MLRSLLCVALTTFLATSLLAAGPAADLESRRKALADLLNERWEYNMLHDAIYASILGDKRYNDRVHDSSQKAMAKGPPRCDDQSFEVTKVEILRT